VAMPCASQFAQYWLNGTSLLVPSTFLRCLATETATRQKHTTVTNNSGEYLLPQLPLGEYKLTALLQKVSKYERVVRVV
jgi:hypothetical protein